MKAKKGDICYSEEQAWVQRPADGTSTLYNNFINCVAQHYINKNINLYQLRQRVGHGTELGDVLSAIAWLHCSNAGANCVSKHLKYLQNLDSDKDGIKDLHDPTPFGANSSNQANNNSNDSDGDGVVNSMDACDNTPAGLKVNSKGCAQLIVKAMAVRSFYTLTDDSYTIIGEVRDPSGAKGLEGVKVSLPWYNGAGTISTITESDGFFIFDLIAVNPKIQFIELKEIAQKMYKYYWNQTIYFDLIQSNNPNKRPEFLQIVRAEIEAYYQKEGERQPKHFERIEDAINIKLKKLVTILKKDVSWRFLKLGKELKLLYKYEKGADFLQIDSAQDIANFAPILHESINFKWTQLLENYNTAPRIAKKLQVLDFPEIKRKSLSPFKPFLDAYNSDRVCFICHQPIFAVELSIDHVIPWSFIFSDDLWNLVYAHKSCNSSKSNRILEEKTIIRLERRNEGLLSHLLNDEELSKKKHTKDLEMAIEKDYVRKFWINCKS